ncbi:class I SAM-dependent methyltransferase [Paenibacillus rhizoplanae]
MLVPGAGYGRNTKVFSADFTVYGIELSKPALELGAAWDPGTSFIAGSALEPQLGQPVDAVYCYDVLHLFLAGDRRRLIEASLSQVRTGGLLYFTSFSDEDRHNGCGRELEPGTF